MTMEDTPAEALVSDISRLLDDTLSPEKALVSAATDALDRFSRLPSFPLSLLRVAAGSQSQGLRLAAATYLKNFLRRRLDEGSSTFESCKEFRNQLAQALLEAEPAVLKVLAEALRFIVVKDFVKENSWPELIPELSSVVQSSNLLSQSKSSRWKTINALTFLKTIVRPFQYFLNPEVRKECVPPQLELIAKNVLVPLQASTHEFVNKVLSLEDQFMHEYEQGLLIICKCIYFTVRSYMPSALSQVLSPYCHDLFRMLDSLNLDGASKEEDILKLKIAKRSLLIFCALVTRHRKHADKLLPSIVTCASKLAKQSTNISEVDSLSERVISLAFDVISHVLQTGPGWRIVSPHFSSLLDSAIFPALIFNQKDLAEWEEDTDEYIRKNLPSDLDEISGWAEDLFTARKSAINLLGVIAMSKGPPVAIANSKRKKLDKNKGKQQHSSIGELLVLPFLSKFPIPRQEEKSLSKTLNNYYGVLMAYGGLQDFLIERNSQHTTTLVQNRVFPLYESCSLVPHLVATANWVLGQLASCLPEAISSDVYNSLIRSLTMPAVGDMNFYPVRASAAGAIASLLENEYNPPDWFSLLEVLVNLIGTGDENEASLLFQLLGTVVEAGQDNVATCIPMLVSSIAGAISKHLPSYSETWPQVVERGFAALASIIQTWEASMPEEGQNKDYKEWKSAHRIIARTCSTLLQHAWLLPMESVDMADSKDSPPPSCIDDASMLLKTIMLSVTTADEFEELKIKELLSVWAALIADWHAWEEMEDLAIFDCIQETANLHERCNLTFFFMRKFPHDPFPGSAPSIVEGISTFVADGIAAYPSATWRACSCVHTLLHVPHFSYETEGIKQLIAAKFAEAAFSRFKDVLDEPVGLWKPLLLVISSCYILYPENIEKFLDTDEQKGFTTFASGLARVASNSFEPGLSSESEIKLAVITLVKLVERLISSFPNTGCTKELIDCFVSLLESCIRLENLEDKDDNEEEECDDEETDEEEDEEDDEDSEDDEREETEEEFLDRYAKEADELSDVVEEGDVDVGSQDIRLGPFEQVDTKRIVFLLLEKYHPVLVGGGALPSALIQETLSQFPEYSQFFQAYSRKHGDARS